MISFGGVLLLILPQLCKSSTQGRNECPCTNPWSDPLIPNPPNAINDGVPCRELTWSSFPFGIDHGSTSSCVPLDYGASTCNAWNQNNAAFALSCAGPNPDDWCSSPWCFVDPTNCTFDSNSIDSAPSDIDGLELYQSYTTCDNKGVYDFENVYRDLKGTTLRVGYPPDLVDTPPLHLFTTDAGYKDGVAVQFLFRVLERTNFSISVANFSTSEESLERFSPSNGYTACIHDVSLGKLDMCIGSFTITEERRILSGFTGNTFLSPQVLIVLREPANNPRLIDSIMTPISPFMLETWVLMLFSVFYMSFVLLAIRETYDGQYNPMSSKRQIVTSRATKSIYHGFLSLTSGTVNSAPVAPKLAERIVIVGFAIFGFVFLTAYMASFTVRLINNDVRGEFSSVDEVLDANEKICAIASSLTGFLTEFPQAVDSVIQTLNNTQTLHFLDDGSCAAGVMSSSAFSAFISSDLGHCKNKTTTGSDFFFSLPSAMPISGRFEHFLSTIVQRGLAEGLFETLDQEFRKVQLPPSLCDNTKGTASDSEDKEDRLSIMQMISAIFPTLLCTTIGLLMHLRVKYHFFLSRLSQRFMIKNRFAKARRDLLAHTIILNRHNFDGPDEDEDLRESLLSMTASELLEELREKSVSQTSLNEAMNCLPSTLALVDLVYRHKCSQKCKDMIFMETLSQLVLYNLLIKVVERKDSNDDLDTKMINKALDDVHNPKGKLVSLVLSSADATEVLEEMQQPLPENTDDLSGISDLD